MRVLLTGGSGLIGRHLLHPLSERHDLTVFDRRIPPRGPWRAIAGDVLDPAAVGHAAAGHEAVLHLAGIPHPLSHSAETVFETNVAGTFNAVESAVRHGAGRFVFLSSESVLGFAFATRRPPLQALPVDESHPVRPQDAYGLGKLAGEMIAAAATERAGIETVCVRPPWVWVPEERALHRDLLDKPESFAHSLWSYIEVEDLADVVVAALERPLPTASQVFFAAAPDCGARGDVRDLVSRFYPEARHLAVTLSPRSPLISSGRLASVLGVSPRRSWRDVPGLA